MMAERSPIICVFCGQDITMAKQKPVPVDRIEFRPFIGGETPATDILTALHSCHGCYADILANRAKAIKEIGKIREVKED